MNNFSNDPYSQPTVPGQFGPLPQQPTKPPKPPLFDIKARRAYYKQYPLSKKKQFAIGCGTLIGILLLCGVCSAITNTGKAPLPTTAQVATPTLKPTATPTMLPTPTPSPVPTPTPVSPTPTPEPIQSQPTQAPPTGVKGNPWGYDFNPGSYIYNPPAAFCSYFSCIDNFPNGHGYVEECQDGMYSQSGGIRGSCSHHGGDKQPLYSH